MTKHEGRPLSRTFYRRDPRVVAVELLNKVLVGVDGRSGRIVETEAYCGSVDPAAHAYRGKTRRNATMFGPPGKMYVYFTYGMYWCCNAVCGEVDEGVAVLLRALAPLDGVEAMRLARPKARRDRDLCSGPARLAQALGIAGAQDGIDLVTGDGGYRIVDDGTPPPRKPVVTGRIGITRAVDEPWRWYVADDPNVSRR
ncbi:MAG TPA: DNA-3-methyladenine glycosylase [Rhodanobacter sp.]|nr:DNA-3-methyladenine glycosylase [Rhodanobacter sp.]